MNESVDCIGCRSCGYGDTAVMQTQRVTVGVLKTVRRRRKCVKCGATYRTLEMPDEIGKEMWDET